VVVVVVVAVLGVAEMNERAGSTGLPAGASVCLFVHILMR
jgi:hypothetical protein